jgi:DNA-binding GntR family transcriptional regulator
VPAPKSTRTKKIIEKLESQILTGALKPGDRLDEVELARRFNVSRTPIHEALRQLAGSALVEMRPRQSPVVASLTIPRLIQMFEVMGELEGMCARLACGRITGAQRDALGAANAACAAAFETGDIAAFYDANTSFHETIYRASGNQFLCEETLSLRNRLAPYRRQVTYQPGRMKASVEEHARALEAIVSVKPIAADHAMRTHVELLRGGVSDFVMTLAAESEDDSASELMGFIANFG